MAFWEMLQQRLVSLPTAEAHDTVYRQALQLVNSNEAKAFDLSEEPSVVREAYGASRFGQGCLVARRLVERGVPFVEVTLGSEQLGWDTHTDNFSRVKELSQQLDAGWSNLAQRVGSTWFARIDDRVMDWRVWPDASDQSERWARSLPCGLVMCAVGRGDSRWADLRRDIE